MSITHCLRNAGLSLVALSALSGGCGDDGDSITDDQSQSEEDDATGTSSTGSSSTSTRAGRSGGSAGSSAAVAGSVARGGTGGRGESAGSGGRRSVPRDEAGSGGTGGRRTTTPPDSAGVGGATELDDAGVDTISLNDGQIAEIINVVNTAEITLGTLALNRAQLPATQDYARSMITMHTAAQDRQTALVGAIGLTPSPSAISAQLTEDTVLVRDQLESATAAELDVLYLRSQVALHSTVLETFDEQLTPNVTSDMLRAELVVARADVAAHLEEALVLLATQEGVDSTDAGVP